MGFHGFIRLVRAWLVLFAATAFLRSSESLVYFGTFTGGKSEGIHVAHFDSETGRLTPAIPAARLANPTFISRHPTLPVLYAISERTSPEGRLLGTVEAFAIAYPDGTLSRLGGADSSGGVLCYVQADGSGSALLCASYREGYVVTFSLQENGAPAKQLSFIAHSGSSVHPRQKSPHAHCIDLDPANRFALVADLGLDKVFAYRFDAPSGTITRMPAPFVTKPGAGPRHLAFDRDGRHVYLVNEIDNTLCVADYDQATGRMTEKQLLPLLPEGFKGESTAAEVVIHPNGRFLYASNRGHDSIALFLVTPSSGLLKFDGYQQEGIKHPRHMAIDPTGRWLICANRDADTATAYEIDPNTGRLGAIASSVAVPAPSCVLFVPPGK